MDNTEVKLSIGKICQKCHHPKPLAAFKEVSLKSSPILIHRDRCLDCEDAFKKSRLLVNFPPTSR